MGSKGSQTTVQQQQTTNTPNPYVAGAGQASLQGAEYAAGQPFQMPVAPLAPFTPFQDQAFGQIQGAQGMAQPYFGAGAGYLAGSAAPVTGGDVANYYNPMAGNVMANLQDVFGQQMKETTGNLTQQAGGVGADRIAVGQSQLAKQQGLAAGQTMAGLYYPALQAAQQQKQMMAGAGYGFGQMGPAAQNAYLQGTGALMGAGTQQQGLSQQYLNNLYANRLAQIGYPFQTAQYLAGITGGVAPAMGGVTQGYGQTTQPGPSLASQLLGIGTAGVGLYGATGGFNSGGFGYSGWPSTTYGAPSGSWGSYGGVPYPAFDKGGRVATGMKGGGSAQALPPPPETKYTYDPKPIGQSGALSASIPPGGMSTEQAISEANPFFKYYGDNSGGSGIPSWATRQIGRMTTPAAYRSPFSWPSFPGLSGLNTSQEMNPFGNAAIQKLLSLAGVNIPQTAAEGGAIEGGLSPIPDVPLQPGKSNFPDLMKMSSPQGGGGGSGDLGKVADIAMKVLPMLMVARGGSVGPFDVGQPMQGGGDPDNPFTVDQPHLGLGDVLGAAKRYYSPMLGRALEAGSTDDPLKGVIPQAYNKFFSGPRPTTAAVAPPAPSAFQLPGEAPAEPRARPQEASLVDPSAKLPDVYQAGHSELGKAYGPQVASAILGNLGVESPTLDPAETHDQGTGIGIAGWRNERKEALYDFAGKQRLDPLDRRTQLAFLQHEIRTNPQYADMLRRMQAAGSPAEAARIFRMEFERPAGTTQGSPLGLDRAQQLATQFQAGNFGNVGGGGGGGQPQLRPQLADYQPILDRYRPTPREPLDWGQQMVRSPWMGLVGAGAAMASTPGPIGSVIGAGLAGAAKTWEGQRKALNTEELTQQKAETLMERAEHHLREFERKKDYAEMRGVQHGLELELKRQRIEQQGQGREDYGRARERAVKELQATKYPAGNIPEGEIQELLPKYLKAGAPTAGATEVGTKKQFKGGTYEKIKEGPDADQSTWSKVGA